MNSKNFFFSAFIFLVLIEQSVLASVFWIGSKPAKCTVEGKSVKRSVFQKRYSMEPLLGEENVFLDKSGKKAIKKVEGSFCKTTPKEYELAKLIGDHEHFHKIFSVYIDSTDNQDEAYLVMEYIDGVKLDARDISYDLPLARSLTAQLLRATIHLAENNINPFDLAPHNILVDVDKKLRVIDWEGFESGDDYDPLAFDGVLKIIDLFAGKNKKIGELFGIDYFKQFDDFASLKRDLDVKLDILSDENWPAK